MNSDSNNDFIVDLPEKSKENGLHRDEQIDDGVHGKSKHEDTYSGDNPNNRPLRKKSILKKLFKKSSNAQYFDECKRGCLGRIFFNSVWLVVLAVMIFYTYEIANQYTNDSRNPSNTVTYLQREELPLPQVVVCNWNSDNTTSNNDSSCPLCELELVDCIFINTSADCTSWWKRTYINTIVGVFHCYTFNDNPNNVTWSVTVAYAGSFATVFKVPITNSTLPSPLSPRGGLQVTFGVQGNITPNDIYLETHFAQIGTDTFYAISAINTIHGDLSPDDPNYNTTIYDTTSSGLTLLDAFQPNMLNATSGYIGVSFAFKTLNLEVINYGFTYTLENFFGDFAGMIGTLMGLDTIKVMTAIPVGWAAIKMRTCLPLEELFNG